MIILTQINNCIRKILLLCLLVSTISILSAQDHIASGFFDQKVSEGYTLPVGIRFDHQNIAFVWEKSGKLYTLDPIDFSKNLLLDISEEVASWGDHGFTGFTFDPEFSENGKIYLAYTVDRHYLFNFGTNNYDPDSTILKNATIGRVTSYSVDNSIYPYQIISSSRNILLGKTYKDGFPILADFHGIGSLAFGKDGTLFVGCGDGGLDNEPNVTYHTNQALKDGIIDSTMILGSYRSQSIYSMNGKLLRINPETGDGIPSNPYFMENNPRSPQSRIWSLGLRNPYKFFHIEETGSHNPDLGDPGFFVVGDVGSSYWEEFNIVKEKAQNFGWPVYEGQDKVWPYGFYEIPNPFAPNPLFNDSDCGKPLFIFQDLIKQDMVTKDELFLNPCSTELTEIPDSIPTYYHSRPFLFYNNKTWNPPTRTLIPSFDETGNASVTGIDEQPFGVDSIFDGFSALPGFWNESGFLPDSFDHSIIVSDFSGWLKAFKVDENLELTDVIKIRSDISGIVDVTVNKSDKCIYYINIISNEVRKICHDGNPPPIAVAKADTLYGNGALTVNFDASDSYDPNMTPIEIEWDFGDGQISKETYVQHTFTTNLNEPVKFNVILTVSDTQGAQDSDSIFISLNNSPPTADIISPIKDSKYAINGYNRFDFNALVTDNEEDLENLTYEWQIHLHHNSHFHSEEPVNKKTFSTLLEPIGCGEKDLYWYRVNLKVKDSYGLEGNDEMTLYPNCEEYYSIFWDRHDATGNSIIINWVDEGIQNLDHFMVQKISDQGRVTDIGEVGKENAIHYSFTDYNPIDGENRYRLKIYTSPTTYYYSTEKVAIYPVIDPLFVFPNPNSSGGFNIILDQPYNEKINVEIFTITGVKLKTFEFQNMNPLFFKKYINAEIKESGIYVLKLTNGGLNFRRLFEVMN